MSVDEIALLGHLIGDGCTLPRHAIQYTTHELELAETVANLATSVFGNKVVPRIQKERDWYQTYLYANYHLTHRVRNPITEWLDELGIFGLRSYEKREHLASLAQSDTYWDEILSIESDGEAEVYDLTVDRLHNFVAGDIIVHNSIEQDADIVMFIYRDDVYNPESERKNIADIIIAKHRNGPVGEVSLYFQASQTRFHDLEVSPQTE